LVQRKTIKIKITITIKLLPRIGFYEISRSFGLS